jgi:Fe-S-cluster containining protein
MKMRKKFSNYKTLISKVEIFSKKVHDKYSDEIACKKGCSSCCEKVLSFFPVEFFHIVEYIRTHDVDTDLLAANVDSIKKGKVEVCPFLHKKVCMIYDARPIICRTFGLPAIMVDNDAEKVEYQVCDKNFKDKSMSLKKEHVINLNTLNNMLYIINSVFVNLDGRNDETKDRFSVLDIIKYI